MSEIHRKLDTGELNRLTTEEFKQAQKIPVTIVLDNIRSQHNIGSVFRTCDAFRVEEIILCGISATPPNREIHKTALGAELTVKWNYEELSLNAVTQLKENGYIIISVEQTKNSCSLESFLPCTDKKYALVFGNEVKGVSSEIISLSDICLEIPQFGSKHSFNVSVSAGIVLWELFRKISNL